VDLGCLVGAAGLCWLITLLLRVAALGVVQVLVSVEPVAALEVIELQVP
jgi:hypothetical protein